LKLKQVCNLTLDSKLNPTSFTMLRRASLTSISGNKPSRKKLDLLTKGKIAEQAKLGAELTQIGRSLNMSRTIVQRNSILRSQQATT